MREAILVFLFGSVTALFLTFLYVAGPPQNWSAQNFAELGTFLGGTIGPVALIFAVLQYTDAERNRAQIAKEESKSRLKTQLAHSIEKVASRIDLLLDDDKFFRANEEDLDLRILLGTGVSFIKEYAVFDYEDFRLEIANAREKKPERPVSTRDIYIVERCATLAIYFNRLKILLFEYEKIVGNNLKSLGYMDDYRFVMATLIRKRYPIEKWDDSENS